MPALGKEFMKHRTLRCFAVALMLASPLPAAAQSGGDQWRFSIMPYLWLPTIDATLKFHTRNGNPEVNAKANPDDYIDKLDMALLLMFEARKGKWLVFTDITYMDLSADRSSVRSVDFNVGLGPINVATGTLNTGTETEMQSTIWTLAGGYNLVHGPKASLDLIGGVRYLSLEATTNWQLTASVVGPGGGSAVFPAAGSVTEKGEVWDGIVGVRGRFGLGEGNWFVPFHLDAGTGESQYTLQAQAGIGYAFRWGDLVLAYRHLVWEQDDDTKPSGAEALRLRLEGCSAFVFLLYGGCHEEVTQAHGHFSTLDAGAARRERAGRGSGF
jgi:hypothetical protein